MIRYFGDLWSGALPLARVLIFDMLAVGTLVNFITMLGVLALLAAEAPTAVAVAVYIAHIPYNVVLYAGVWRSAEREGANWAWLARGIATVWLLVTIFV